MICVSVLYPNVPGARFDFDCYTSTHRALVEELLTPEGLRSFTIEQGISGATGDEPPPYRAVARLVFDSIEAYRSAMQRHADELATDAARCTDIEASRQVSHVVG